MDSVDLIRDAFARIADELPGKLEGMSPRSLLHRAQKQGHSVSWLAFTMDEDYRVVDAALLSDYYRAVSAASARVLESGAAENLDRVLEGGRSVGSSLVELLNEITKDLGQIAFLRGLTDSIKAMHAKRRTEQDG